MNRLIALVSVLCLGVFGLTACGGEAGTKTSDSGVEVSGAFGKAPKVTFDKTPFSVKKSKDWVAIEGNGKKVDAQDSVSAHITLFNGQTGKKLISTLDQGGEPLATSKSAGNLFPILVDAFEGRKVGTRVVVEAAPADAYGEAGNPQNGIEKNTTILMVADIMKADALLTEPKGETVPPQKGDPKLKLTKDVPSGFDFAGATKPSKLKVVTLIKGDGPTTKKGQTVTVNYLGSEWGSKKVFDASYPRNQTFPVQLGSGGVIPAWDQGLEGVSVGSRILIIAPPDLAYGKAGQPPTIGKNATLVFVVDVLGAS